MNPSLSDIPSTSRVSFALHDVFDMLVIYGAQLGCCQGTKLSEEDIALYEQWNAYKKEKNFDEADRVRKELTERGIL